MGNGLSINVHADHWIVKNGTASPLMCETEHSNFLRVADLIDFNSGKWDLPGVSEPLDDDTKSAILSIPLSKKWPMDSLY